MRTVMTWLACLAFAPALAVGAGALDSLSNAQKTDGLRTALTQAAQAAVANLGRTDGFLGNPEVRIPLPGKLEKASRTLKKLGASRQVDDLSTAMNRAAEAAVPEARALLVDAVRQMSVQDAASILTGPQDAATQYFRRTTQARLAERFLPVVARETGRLGLAKRYDNVAGKAAQLGLLKPEDASLDSYVTQKALDGLFLMMAKEEAAIRKDPLGQASSVLKTVFGALKK